MMAGQMPEDPSQHGIVTDAAYMVSQYISNEPQYCTPKWYFSRQEIENHSPSKKDGIDFKKETQLRKLYCSFLQELGMKLKVPQVTIATAMIFCHRFYLHQSHAKNEWQIIAMVSMFLACKAEETPRLLRDVVVVAYETIYRRDPTAPQRIKQKDVYEKQKELILSGERLLLATMAFDLNIQHPYKPLVAAVKRLNISNSDLVKVAWNFVNDWLWTTLCLEYKPQYIAAGSLFLAAKFQKVKLPSERGKVWWLEFDVSPKLLEEIIQHMLRLLEQNRRKAMPSVHKKANEAIDVVEKKTTCSPQSCVLSGSVTACDPSQGTEEDVAVVGGHTKSEGTNVGSSQNLACGDTCITLKRNLLQCQASDCGSTRSVVEDSDMYDEGEVQPRTLQSSQNLTCKIVTIHGGFCKIDKDRIREALKRRRCHKATNKVVEDSNDAVDAETWIERELENGIELDAAFADKRQRNASSVFEFELVV